MPAQLDHIKNSSLIKIKYSYIMISVNSLTSGNALTNEKKADDDIMQWTLIRL